LKNNVSNASLLAFPEFRVPFILTTDTSTVGLVAALFQVQEGIERPISFKVGSFIKQKAYSAS
jgi:hypothetical protein